MRWFEFDQPEGCTKQPEWMMLVAMGNDGRVYVPAIVTGSEEIVYFCVIEDNAPAVVYEEHLYVCTEWLRAEFPKTETVCRLAELRVREQLTGNQRRILH